MWTMKVNSRSHTGTSFGIPCKNICLYRLTLKLQCKNTLNNANKKGKDIFRYCNAFLLYSFLIF